VGVGEEAYYACNFDSDRRLSMRSLKSDLGNELVKPIEPSDYPEGIDIIFDHRRLVDFRNEYQFHYDSGSPSDIEENAENGISTALHTDNELYARFRPHSESLDMTTLSFRFKPVDFPHVSMRFMIMDGVNRADPIYGGNGMHDSALYIRFALRELKPGQSRASAKGLGTGDIYLFSYYWGEQLVDGQEDRPLGKPYLNYYSESYNVLPKAQWLPLQRSSPETLGRPWTFDRNLANDIAAAYPAVNIDNMEVLAITIVSDANHTKDIADAWFKFLKFMRD
jgi:hypothetical protein